MIKILNIIFFNFLFSSNVFSVPMFVHVPLNTQGNVSWNVDELNVKDHEMVKLIVDKYRVFKVTIKNSLDKDIAISLSNYFYGFCRNTLLKDNILDPFSIIPAKTALRKLIFYGPFWVNWVAAIATAVILFKEEASELCWITAAAIFGSTTIMTSTWSLMGWFFSLKQFNKMNKQYKFLNACEPKIELPKFFFKKKKPKTIGDRLIIPAKSEMTDYLFVPIAFPINFEGALLTYFI
ncbi:MAG: hypothetical protein ABIF12_01025 [bacterium]